MKDVIFDDFQNAVDESLLRHRSILDILTKLQESESRINRAVAKSITTCGCIQVDSKNQKSPEDMEIIDIEDLKKCLKCHTQGALCENCKGIIESEIGNNLFYLASLCNLLDLNLYDILLRELSKINTLGKYNLR